MELFKYFSIVFNSIWKDFIDVFKYSHPSGPKLLLGVPDIPSYKHDNFEQGGSRGDSNIVSFDEFGEEQYHEEVFEPEDDDDKFRMKGVEEGHIGIDQFEGMDGFEALLQQFSDGSLFQSPTRSINKLDSTVHVYIENLLDLYFPFFIVGIIIISIIAIIIILKHQLEKITRIQKKNKSSKAVCDKIHISKEYHRGVSELTPIPDLDYDLDVDLIDSQLSLQLPAYDENLEGSPLNLSYLSDDLGVSDISLFQEDEQLIGPFTLDSANEVEVLTIGADTDLSISIKKNAHEKSESIQRQNMEQEDKIKVGFKIRKSPSPTRHSHSLQENLNSNDIIRKPLTVLNSSETENSKRVHQDYEPIKFQTSSSNMNEEVPVSTIVLESKSRPPTEVIYKDDQSVLMPVETQIHPTDLLNYNPIKDLESEIEEASNQENSLQEKGVSSTLSVLNLNTITPSLAIKKQIKFEEVYDPSSPIIGSVSNFDDVELMICPESLICSTPEIPSTPEKIPRKGSILRTVFNEKKRSPSSSSFSPSKIPIISPNRTSLIKSSPTPKSPGTLLRLDEKVAKLLDSEERNVEEYLSDLFGDDPEITIDDEFIDSLDGSDIDLLFSIFHGKESSDNWKERYDHFDILIGHLRSHLPEQYYDYFQEKIFESLDDILDMVSTNRTMLLGKLIIFLRDIVYFGNTLTDETFTTLLQTLIPLTRTSQVSRHINSLTFKSLCLMIQSIKPKSFIQKFESIFNKYLLDKKLKGEKYTCLFMIKFYIIANVENFEDGDHEDCGELESIIQKLNNFIGDLSIDGHQKTRTEIVEIYLLLLKINCKPEVLMNYYGKLSTFLKSKVPKPKVEVNY